MTDAVAEEMKTCRGCGVAYPRADYYNQQHTKDRKFPYCRVCSAERNRVWREANPKKVQASQDKDGLARKVRAYGTDGVDLMAEQNGACAVCGKLFADVGPKNTHIDHCHETGFVRGVLCVRCNAMLGYAYDDPAILRAAADYLDKFEVFK